MYRVFDLNLQSELALPDELGISADTVDLFIHMQPCAEFDEQRFKWFHEWKSPGGGIVMAAAKFENEYLLRFPGLADFHLNPSENSIRVLPTGTVDESTLAHLLLDQVIPRWLSHRGRLVVHASSVELPGGQVVGFLGSSGSGKSTLASSFFASGASLIADDCLLLELQHTTVFARPPYLGLRLWEDSLNRFFPAGTGFQPMAHYTNKQQLICKWGQITDRGDTIPLTALFLLDRADESAVGDDICIEPESSGSFAAAALIESVFALDLSRGDEVKRNFRHVGGILSSGLPVFRLSYPRKYSMLPRVREPISSAAERLGD